METAGSIEWSDGDADYLCRTFTALQSFFSCSSCLRGNGEHKQ